jgi:hypothetical protein
VAFRHETALPVEIEHFSENEIARACGRMTGTGPYVGCAIIKADHCLIYMRERSRNFGWAAYQSLLTHEKAHCNGWQHPVRGNLLYPRDEAPVPMKDRPASSQE